MAHGIAEVTRKPLADRAIALPRRVLASLGGTALLVSDHILPDEDTQVRHALTRLCCERRQRQLTTIIGVG